MLHWFRRRGPYIAATILTTYVSGLVPFGATRAEAAPAEMYEAAADASTLGEYTEDTKAVLEAHLQRSAQPGTAAVPQSAADSPDAQALTQDNGGAGTTISPNAISLPSGAATLGGMGESFTAQLTTGVAIFDVPFTVPKGRAGLVPSLGLLYSSSNGYGLAGVGWSLKGPSAISRQTDRGVPHYDDRDDWHPEQDRFVFGGQELVPICRVTSGQCTGALQDEVMPPWSDGWQYFRARVEGGFLRFFWSPDHLTWRVQSQDGMTMEFGMPLDGSGYTNALERNPSKQSEVFRWHIVRQYDSHGAPDAVPPAPVNVIQFRYVHSGNVSYLTDVYYTPPANDPGTSDFSTYAHHVTFGYEARPDPSVSYRSGWLLEQRVRLARVDVASKPFESPLSASREMVRRFHLEYESTTHASLLNSVTYEGRCSEPVVENGEELLGATSCPRLPPMSFEYQRVKGAADPPTDSNGLEFERFATELREVQGSPEHSLGSGASLSALMDVNSDGLPDVVVTNPALFGGNHGVYFNRGEVNGQVRFAPPATMAVTGVQGVDANVLKLSNSNVAVLDYDGNAAIDLVHMPMVRRYSVFEPRREGNSWFWRGREITTASGQDVKINFAQDARRTAVMDVDGDGLVDVVFASATEYQTFFALGRYPGGDGQFGHARWTGPESTEISNDPVAACAPWSSAAVRLGDPDVRVADVNGDGLPDIVRLRAGQIMYWPGRGNGYWGTGERDACVAGNFAQNQHVQMNNAPHFGTVQPGSLHLADVNGDGLADVVEVRADAVDVYLNVNGTGFADRRVLRDVPIRPNISNPVRLTDINGSGSTDLLWGQGHEYRYIDLTGGIRPQLLTKIHNGLGKTTELEYRSSADMMVTAAENGQPWESTMPLSTPVIARVTERDNLERVGRAAGRYVREYSYRDPVFEGRQREFRGFRTAETRTVGDMHSPTSTARSTHLLGECEVAQNGLDVCSFADRWRDNWREPLKGLPVVTETFDEQGTFLMTEHAGYELRQLYAGRDGRRVSIALQTRAETFRYDTSDFDGTATNISVPEIEVHLSGIEQSESRQISRRASQGTARLLTTSEYDDYGHVIRSTEFGCVEGCPTVDEAITVHSVIDRVAGDTSGWLWRPMESFATGSVHADERRRRRHEYNARGDMVRSLATLSGTLPLDRFHESTQPVAPNPPNASGGVSAPVEIEVTVVEHDDFGNEIAARGPHGRCGTVDFDGDYAELAVEEVVFGGAVGSGGCGEQEFVTQAVYDRGLALVVASVDVTSQPSTFEYDGFGRLVAETYVDPLQPGVLASLPSMTYEYVLPTDWRATPYSVLVARSQDGQTTSDGSYYEQFEYLDGLDRTLVVLAEADPSAGDEGAWVVTGRVEYTTKGEELHAYESHFWTGAPLAFPLGERPPLRYATQLYDAFERPTHTYGLDGRLSLATVHHALGFDRWDAADLSPGPHAGSFGTLRTDGHSRQIEAVERVRVNGVLEERRTLSEYLPTGELSRVTQSRAGSPDIVRWMLYDSLGRMVLNAEPNTSVGFDPDPQADVSSLKAWRYAYNDAGDLVGVSDARGCGVNYHYDAAGRIIAEDHSPCLNHHSAYTAPNFTASTGIEVLYRYDTADPDTGSIEDAAERALEIDTSLLLGRLVSVSDLGRKSVFSYDARGRLRGQGKRIVKPGAADSALAERYAPRWYIQEHVLDVAARPLESSTGASRPELMGAGGRSVIQKEYSARGLLKQVSSSYGVLLQSQVVDANELPRKIELGDAAGTQRVISYDEQHRIRSAQTFRGGPQFWSDPPQGYSVPVAEEPTQQLLLEDYDFEYDAAGNVTKITDWRLAHEWPDSAKPVTRKYEYDDLYRLTRATYEYPGGKDPWTSPFDAENRGGASVESEPRPSPHVHFSDRLVEQRYEYDHLGNRKRTTDDAHGFFDRSLGAGSHGSPGAGPHQLRSASNRAVAPASPRQGDLDVDYDDAGNITDLIVRRDGPCLPEGASCWQRYHYEWDEVGQIRRAQRWDLAATNPNERTAHAGLEDAVPPRPADAELRYAYDGGGKRTLKTAVDPANNQRHTVYIFGSLELRRAALEGAGNEADYSHNADTESVLLHGGVTARVVYAQEDLPSLSSGNLRLFLLLDDYLGSNTFIIDHETSELVEYATYQAYGATESNYRPERWESFREPYKFTGKEEDVEVGLAYFGARYLSVGLGVWMSPDPVTIHEVRSDPNPYAYVKGRPAVAIDPDGRELLTAILVAVVVGAAIGALAGGASYTAATLATGGDFKWKDFWKSVGYGAVAGGIAGGMSVFAAPLAPAIGKVGVKMIAWGTAGAVVEGHKAYKEYKNDEELSKGKLLGKVAVRAGFGAVAYAAGAGVKGGAKDLAKSGLSSVFNEGVGKVGGAMTAGAVKAFTKETTKAHLKQLDKKGWKVWKKEAWVIGGEAWEDIGRATAGGSVEGLVFGETLDPGEIGLHTMHMDLGGVDMSFDNISIDINFEFGIGPGGGSSGGSSAQSGGASAGGAITSSSHALGEATYLNPAQSRAPGGVPVRGYQQ